MNQKIKAAVRFASILLTCTVGAGEATPAVAAVVGGGGAAIGIKHVLDSSNAAETAAKNAAHASDTGGTNINSAIGAQGDTTTPTNALFTGAAGK